VIGWGGDGEMRFKNQKELAEQGRYFMAGYKLAISLLEDRARAIPKHRCGEDELHQIAAEYLKQHETWIARLNS
jgi:hypothetical protein